MHNFSKLPPKSNGTVKFIVFESTILRPAAMEKREEDDGESEAVSRAVAKITRLDYWSGHGRVIFFKLINFFIIIIFFRPDQ